MNKSIHALLPLLNESINSFGMVRHCMEVVSKITNKPVYALGKQVQWAHSEKYENI